ncbi:MAG: 4a-hydroxytetrahydrobiopterin dehydratase [Patescibacteria group bacterium]
MQTFPDKWVQHEKLTRKVKTADFVSAVELINKICEISEKHNHHPNLCLDNYNELTIEVYTHDAQKITEKDIALANELEKLL